MPKLPRLTALDAERLLFKSGFELMRSKGSHRIYFKGGVRVVLPFHRGKSLHPRIVREVIEAIGAE